MKFTLLITFCLGITSIVSAQSNNTNPITSTIPFLNISPDARSGALGDAGVAISPDVNTLFWNPSKLAFIETNTSFSLSYSPWLNNLDKDMNLAYAVFSHKLSNRDAFGLSINYFNIGKVDIYDENLNSLGSYRPNEFSFEGAYSRKFGENFSLGLALKYIHSGINSGTWVEGEQTQAVDAVAAGASLFYTKKTQQFGKSAIFSFGAYISNIGPKIRYTDSGRDEFLPTNLKIGAANTWILDERSQLTFALDLNKLLIPTPPLRDASGNIIKGKDDDRSVVSGIFGSFTDAPDGFSEEIKEITLSPALEYWYNKQFALRAGYCYESPDKGNRKYVTMGAGFRYRTIDIGLSYLAANQNKSALANTLRFSLALDLGK
jgi:hypothetical protein